MRRTTDRRRAYATCSDGPRLRKRPSSENGTLVLYTGAPIVEGQDILRDALESMCREAGARWTYEEVDPDVFGSELELPQYAGVERIAAVGMVARTRD